MNKIYEFTLADGGNHYVIGAGTLEDGIAIIEDMYAQFVAWTNDPDKFAMFKLRIPSDNVPIYVYEGSILLAAGGPFGEELFENYYYTMDNKWELSE